MKVKEIGSKEQSWSKYGLDAGVLVEYRDPDPFGKVGKSLLGIVGYAAPGVSIVTNLDSGCYLPERNWEEWNVRPTSKKFEVSNG